MHTQDKTHGHGRNQYKKLDTECSKSGVTRPNLLHKNISDRYKFSPVLTAPDSRGVHFPLGHLDLQNAVGRAVSVHCPDDVGPVGEARGARQRQIAQSLPAHEHELAGPLLRVAVPRHGHLDDLRLLRSAPHGVPPVVGRGAEIVVHVSEYFRHLYADFRYLEMLLIVDPVYKTSGNCKMKQTFN